MPTELPKLFEDKLRSNSKEQGIVYAALADFGAWFENSRTPFFPDYTDHGTKHISGVLATAAALIPEESIDYVSIEDVTILTLAALLHDAALHLTEAGFAQLVQATEGQGVLEHFDSKTWPELWREFLFSARRWDDQQLIQMFGDDFVHRGLVVTDPFQRWGNLTQTDFKLIGEFIRIHHPRLAHEFAVFGVPGVEGRFLKLPEATSSLWSDLAGLVARSHGLPLRPCLDYMETKGYHKREFQGIHTPYLMALIRLADYLQLEADRAPSVVFSFRVLPSRISQLEWRAHDAIQNITPLHEDPESVQIDANPPNAETYIRVRQWLEGIQQELDSSWAVLGEVYGRFTEVNLDLRWRRVRSNLDNREAFAKTVDYLPRRIRLEVARAELLSLLIRPLYGDDPTYGVRELIQNAVDAVREREYLQHQDSALLEPICLTQGPEQEADVVVCLDDYDEDRGSARFEIRDTGIGMTEEILTNYFLRAGASYRRSEKWQQQFEFAPNRSTQNAPRSQVLRSGRFGVGALAAFLLGTKIDVETRHLTATDGYRFSVTLNQEAIQVERVQGLPTGTRITAYLDKSTFEALRSRHKIVSKPWAWDWYVLNSPTVVRKLGADGDNLESQYRIDLSKWHSFRTQGALDVQWVYPDQLPDLPSKENLPRLSCNGIFVSESARLPRIKANHAGSESQTLRTPTLHIKDADGHLPLDLARKGLITREYGFEEELANEITKDYLARLLIQFPESLDPESIKTLTNHSPLLTADYRKARIRDVFLSASGFALPISLLPMTKRSASRVLLVNQSALPSAKRIFDRTGLEPWDFILALDNLIHGSSEIFNSDNPFKVSKFKIGTSQNTESSYRNSWLGYSFRDSKLMGMPTQEKKIHKSLHTISSKPPLNSSFSFEDFLKTKAIRSGRSKEPFAMELTFANLQYFKIPKSPFDRLWLNFFGRSWIPWRKDERRARFPKAYNDLATFIKRYEV